MQNMNVGLVLEVYIIVKKNHGGKHVMNDGQTGNQVDDVSRTGLGFVY